MKRSRQYRNNLSAASRRGSVMVEFSLAFVAFITMIMATVDIGRAVWTYGVLNHAIFQGARFATVHGSGNLITDNQGQDDTAAAIRDIIRNNTVGLDSSQVTVNTSYNPNNDPGSEFTVTASYPINTVFGTFFFSGSPDRIECPDKRSRPPLNAGSNKR